MSTVTVNFSTSVDVYGRYAGMAIDEPLVSRWWTDNPPHNIGIASPPNFTFSEDISFEDGEHSVEVGISSPTSYPWNAEILIDGELLVSGEVNGGAFLTGSFIVGVDGEVTPVVKPLEKLMNLIQRFLSRFREVESKRL